MRAGVFNRYHAAVLKLCTIGKCEVAMARHLTFGEYCTVANATIKVFFVLMNETTAKVAELIQTIDHYNSAVPLAGDPQQPQSQPQQLPPSPNAPPTNSNTSGNHMGLPTSWQSSSALNVPVLCSQEVPSVGDTNTNVPDCLKLLRSLSSEIVLPRSISNEILLPFGIFSDMGPGPPNPTLNSNVAHNPGNTQPLNGQR